MTRRCPLAFVLMLSACQSQDPGKGTGTATLTGTNAFTVHSAIAAVVDGGTSASGFWLVDTNTDCDDVKKRGFVPFIVSAVVGVVDATTDDTLVPGDLPVDGGQALYLDGGARDASARMSLAHQDGRSEPATLGTVSYEEADAAHLKGHFDVTLSPDGGTPYTLAGTFDAPVCPGFKFQ